MKTHSIAIAALVMSQLALGAGSADPKRFSRFFGFTLWHTTLAEVGQALGPTSVSQAGDASSSATSLCYATAHAFVTFSSGEMGGGRLLEAIAVSEEPPSQSCAPLRTTPPEPSTQFDGIQLGMSAAQFRAALPSAMVWEVDRGHASYHVSAPFGSALELVTVSAKLKGGKVVQFSVNRNEQN